MLLFELYVNISVLHVITGTILYDLYRIYKDSEGGKFPWSLFALICLSEPWEIARKNE